MYVLFVFELHDKLKSLEQNVSSLKNMFLTATLVGWIYRRWLSVYGNLVATNIFLKEQLWGHFCIAIKSVYMTICKLLDIHVLV